MADVVNLNRFRKRKLREAEQAQAQRNRVVHGRSKADKAAGIVERERGERELEGHRREALESKPEAHEDTTGGEPS